MKLVTEGKLSLPEAVCRLHLPPSTLGNRVKAYKPGRLGNAGKTRRPLTEIEMELARTKKELVELQMEAGLFKNNTYFQDCETITSKFRIGGEIKNGYRTP